ncbi:PIG-L deacetylase family protein [Streptomyces sp. NPDC058405]|uniref:PIG-L deacetylase family protein n=1 Tax=unclassified Streptomyces TaxID=2593676 RepID=UPI00365D3D8C
MTDLFGELGRGKGTVLVLHAHPDDEVFATGAAAASLAQQGCRVVLRVASGGEVNEPRAKTDRIARRQRAVRLGRACRTLGMEWGWLDAGRWLDTGGVPAPNSLTSAPVDDLADAIAREVRKFAPAAILTVGSDGLTGHPDHILMNQAVTRAAEGTVRVFGASLRTSDVAAGHRMLAPVLPGVTVGSGRMTGSARTDLLTVHTPFSIGAARRAALNMYGPGLGNLPLTKVVHCNPGRGDSLLLRAVLDSIGWSTERYEPPV